MKQVLADFLFPSTCLSCEELNPYPLCKRCWEEMPLLPREGRCRYCFTDTDLIESMLCRECVYPHSVTRVGATFESKGPGHSLASSLPYLPHLAKGCAALMMLQLHNLHYPTPDVIVPLRGHPFDRIRFGAHASVRIAKALGKLIGRPVLYGGRRIVDQTVLLIDDRLTTGEAFEHCASELRTFFPKRIDALALIKEEEFWSTS